MCCRKSFNDVVQFVCSRSNPSTCSWLGLTIPDPRVKRPQAAIVWVFLGYPCQILGRTPADFHPASPKPDRYCLSIDNHLIPPRLSQPRWILLPFKHYSSFTLPLSANALLLKRVSCSCNHGATEEGSEDGIGGIPCRRKPRS